MNPPNGNNNRNDETSSPLDRQDVNDDHQRTQGISLLPLSNFSEMQNRRLNLLNFFQPPNYNFQFTHQGHFMQRQRNDPRMNVRRENTSNDNLVHNHGYFYYQTDDVHGRAVRQSLRSVPHGQHKSPIALLQEEHERRKNQELQDERTRTFHEFLFSDQNDLGDANSPRKKSRSGDDGSEEGADSMSSPNAGMDQSTEVNEKNMELTSRNGFSSFDTNKVDNGISFEINGMVSQVECGPCNTIDEKLPSNVDQVHQSNTIDRNNGASHSDSDCDDIKSVSCDHKDNHDNNADIPCVLPTSSSVMSPRERLLEGIVGNEICGIAGVTCLSDHHKDQDDVQRCKGDAETNTRPLIDLIEAALKNPKIPSPKPTAHSDGISLLAKVIETKRHRENIDPSIVEKNATSTPQKKLEIKKLNPTVDMLSVLPTLPCEPEYDMGKDYDQVWDDHFPFVTRPPLGPSAPCSTDTEDDIESSKADHWFPFDTALEKNMSFAENEKVAHPSPDERLCYNVEPGAIEKLPYCKIHKKTSKEQGERAEEPLFCFQVTEMYCNNMILCCSVCSTWRHAECGGHYTFCPPRKCEENFKPVCDRCHKEKDARQKNMHVDKFLARQRDIHLRKTLTSMDLIRHASYSKHGLTSKWPLGSVMPGNIGVHCKGVQIRNERTEKQWADMLQRLENNTTTSAKQRSKDLQFLLNRLEEAEVKTDLHNMILFLERDGKKQHPVGFERPQFNFFDPAEDKSRLAFLNQDYSDDSSSLEEENSEFESPSENEDFSESKQDGYTKKAVNNRNDVVLGRYKSSNIPRKTKLEKNCIREGCDRRPRFDSAFCSDACGVHVMQQDLLRSLNFVNDMHPCRLHN